MGKCEGVKGVASRRAWGGADGGRPLADRLDDELPQDVRERHRLLPLAEAVRLGHKPATESEWLEARRRMGFAELFELQAVFALIRASIAAEPASPIPYRHEVIDAFKRGLRFEPTTAQRRAMWEALPAQDRT